MSDSPIAGGRPGVLESPVTLARTRSGSTTVRPQPVTEQSLMESVAGQSVDRIIISLFYPAVGTVRGLK